MKTVIITSDGLEHRFVTNHLALAIKGTLSGVIVEKPLQQTNLLKKYKKIKIRYGYLRIIERATTKLVRKALNKDRRQNNELKKRLGFLSLNFLDFYQVLTLHSANAPTAVEWLNSVKPDFLFIYGTGVIKSNVLSIPVKGALNLHTGISPFYRGSDTFFWPIYNLEPQFVGATVHKCTPEIDGGDIYGRISAKLSPMDDHYVAFAKCVMEGARLYSDIASKLVSGEILEPVSQNLGSGKEYRFKDLTFIQELIMEYRIRSGSLKKLLSEGSHIEAPF